VRKIISLYQRNYDGDRLVRDEVVPGAEWVLAGEGVATRKYDGTCCEVLDGQLWKRYELRPGKTAPPNFRPAQDEDATTGKQPGWVPVGDEPDSAYHREAWELAWEPADGYVPDGTYELVGPKIQANPEGYEIHLLLAHSEAQQLTDAPREFEALREYLASADIEGIVWHHPDGRMVKIKGKDFGLKRGAAFAANASGSQD
jgi:hypothetical protein